MSDVLEDNVRTALDAIVTATDLGRRALTEADVRAELAARRLVRLARGAYCAADVWAAAGPAERLRLRSVAVAVHPGGRASVVSHVSAAALHGLRVRDESQPARLTAVRGRAGHRDGSAAPGHVRHHSQLRPEDVVEVAGVRVTSLARTAVDCAWLLPFRDAVVTVDSALAREPADACLTVFDAVPRSRVVRVRRAFGAADSRSGSAGETLVRLDLMGRIAAPDLQTRLVHHGSTYFTDFSWWDLGVALEFDGLVKYGGDPAAGDPVDAVVREKRRESDIVAMGWEMARVTWEAVGRPEITLREVSRAAARARARGVEPRVVVP